MTHFDIHKSVVIDQSLISDVDYPDPETYNIFDSLISTQVSAYRDTNGCNYNLTLGASSNVNIEAINNVNIYISDSNALTLYNTEVDNGIRTDTPIFKIFNDRTTTYINSSNFPLSISGMDGSNTTTISQTVFSTRNLYQMMDTPNMHNGFLFNPPITMMSNLDVQWDVTSRNNIACSGNIFSSSLNLYKNESNGALQVAYAFYINEFDQLDLVKYNKTVVSDGITDTTSTIIQKIATFGKNTDRGTGDPRKYNVLNEFNGVEGSNTGKTTTMTSAAWNMGAGGQNIYYNAGYVGIGVIQPLEQLHIGGNLRVDGTVYPCQDNEYNLGSTENTFKSIYAKKIYVNEGTITVDTTPGTGSFIFEGTDNVQINLTALQEEVNILEIEMQSAMAWTASNGNIFVESSNIGINTPNPNYPLDVIGSAHVSSNMTIGNTLSTSNLEISGNITFTKQNTDAGSVTIHNQGFTFIGFL